MKAFLFKVTLVSGLVFNCSGIGYNADDALMDACDYLAQSGEYPQDDIISIDLEKVEEEQA